MNANFRTVDRTVAVKRCFGCQRRLTLDAFGADSCRSDGKDNRCKKCRGGERPRRSNPLSPPELIEGRCYLPGCTRPSLEGDCICAYHACVFEEEEVKR